LPAILILAAILLFTIAQPGIAVKPVKPAGPEIIYASPGSTVTYTGKGTPNTDVNVKVSTSVTIPVSGGRYGITLNNVQIPYGNNRFSISVSSVKTMTVSGYSSTNSGVTASQSIVVNKKGQGSFSKSNVPSGGYSISVFGEAKGPKVNVDASASCYEHVGSNGQYTASVNTQGMPAGTYTVTQDGVTVAKVYLSG
jgi:hypothetical protein